MSGGLFCLKPSNLLPLGKNPNFLSQLTRPYMIGSHPTSPTLSPTCIHSTLAMLLFLLLKHTKLNPTLELISRSHRSDHTSFSSLSSRILLVIVWLSACIFYFLREAFLGISSFKESLIQIYPQGIVHHHITLFYFPHSMVSCFTLYYFVNLFFCLLTSMQDP